MTSKWLVFVAFDDEDAARDYAQAVRQAREVHMPALGTWQTYAADVVGDVQSDLPSPTDDAEPSANLEEEITAGVLRRLKNRSGFDHWWDSLDEDAQLDVVTDLETLVCAFLTRAGL